MKRTPGHAPDSGGSVRSIAQAVADGWSDAEKAQAAFHLSGFGCTQQQAEDVLRALAVRGVRRLWAYVGNWTDEDVSRAVMALQREADARVIAASAVGATSIRPRAIARWPWPLHSDGWGQTTSRNHAV